MKNLKIYGLTLHLLGTSKSANARLHQWMRTDGTPPTAPATPSQNGK